MSWEDEVLAGYERGKREGQQHQSSAMQRDDLLETLARPKWEQLQAALLAKTQEINTKAGREVLQPGDSKQDGYTIQREDGVAIQGTFNERLKEANFNVGTLTRKYVLKIESIDGSETVVWTSILVAAALSPDDIVKELMSELLQFPTAR